ncbi:MAG: PSD1 and planctomycete cytochrome C domain-containing protein [Verrucomicrobiales bacterium]|nr:PSD1 and planctomycete cytochrome C domain-containing protein [Verrucomicrobiales bacterium]
MRKYHSTGYSHGLYRVQFGIVPCLIILFNSLLSAGEPTQGEKLFALKVKPLFAEKCNACHGDEPDKIKGGLDMRTRESILSGGDTFGEEVLIPGKGEESFLYILSTREEEDYEMPPKEADQLSQEQTWWIRDWVDEGAPWPDDKTVTLIQEKYAQGVQVATSKALSDDWQNRRYDAEKLWSYRPLKSVTVPPGENPVDWLLNRKLTAAGLKAATAAGPVEMVRRISFGLTGLPPQPEDVSLFIENYRNDPSAAVGKYSEKLMASHHYGEHFAQHWLDVSRYADSAGFANDYARPNAWRYRDYVVRFFNSDKPYDEFVKEQIAGDEMDPADPENLIATGFLRMGPWEQTGMSVFKETRQLWLDDVTDSVGQTFLAHALQCAKCHDHKFDPVPTRDYYSMMAVFSTTQFGDRNAPFLPVESQQGFAEASKWNSAKLEKYSMQRNELEEKVKRLQQKEQGEAKVGNNGLDPGDENSLARITKNSTRHRIEKDKILPIALSVYTGKTIPKKNIQGRLVMPKKPWAKGNFDTDAILTGGSVYAPGDEVSPAALSAAESLGEMNTDPFPAGMGKRRLALAEWIVDPKNPLTARVMVNRVWSWHFGKGIAGNPNNFGGTGALPTHPDVLDYLADWFCQNGWSVKKLNQLLISSEAYRRSSRHPDPEVQQRLDPKNDLYATFAPRRLTAEEFRDAMLQVSGELVDRVGGVPVRPDINPEVAIQPRQIMGGTASVYEPDPLPEQRNRRSIYTEKIRGLRDPFFETFNQPQPDNSCELRETSTVAPQALTLMNAEEVQDRAVAFADRLLKLGLKSDSDVISKAFELALGRKASAQEIAVCLERWNSATEEERAMTYQNPVYPTSIERTVRAEKTGEFYTFTEYLPAFENYVPDLQKADVDARTRGLSHICVVIFNLNEFAYLD